MIANQRNYFFLVLLAIVFSACSKNEYAEGPKAAPTYGLPPITVKLQNKIIEVLNQTDELDKLIKNGCSVEDYFAAGTPIEQSAMKLEHTLPDKDPRIYLFISSIEEYQQLGLKLSQKESTDELLATDTIAGMRKVLVLGILNGTLTENDEKMFNDMRAAIQSGKM